MTFIYERVPQSITRFLKENELIKNRLRRRIKVLDAPLSYTHDNQDDLPSYFISLFGHRPTSERWTAIFCYKGEISFFDYCVDSVNSKKNTLDTYLGNLKVDNIPSSEITKFSLKHPRFNFLKEIMLNIHNREYKLKSKKVNLILGIPFRFDDH
ncbi:hypothetical protein JWG39_13010 [Desulforhopalus vacuolatus]|uniref:hypothetical protein n=1 Tax=Desulforhopalus vacuolatus TaxID=40414 RepID=UPI0019657F90|nr:hypothetical protein [Desulforhopalus vacuolatus]MBM9520735.1 hypothetical protein [Desulforhopalus vacuolatus]